MPTGYFMRISIREALRKWRKSKKREREISYSERMGLFIIFG